MSPIYSYLCLKCQKETDEYCNSITNRPMSIQCRYCLGIAEYQISGGNFTVNGANADNNYSGDSNFAWLGSKKNKKK